MFISMKQLPGIVVAFFVTCPAVQNAYTHACIFCAEAESINQKLNRDRNLKLS